jgi:uncharacterized lipoprotein YajG
MKNSLKVTTLATLSVVAMLALAGCNQPASTSQTTTDTKTSTSSESNTSSESSAGGKVATPSDATNMNEVEAMGNRVVTYSSSADAKAAFDAQAKMVTDAGWSGSYAGMTAPVEAMGTVTQTFSAGGKILVLTATADPINAGQTMVTMTESDDPMAN